LSQCISAPLIEDLDVNSLDVPLYDLDTTTQPGCLYACPPSIKCDFELALETTGNSSLNDSYTGVRYVERGSLEYSLKSPATTGIFLKRTRSDIMISNRENETLCLESD